MTDQKPLNLDSVLNDSGHSSDFQHYVYSRVNQFFSQDYRLRQLKDRTAKVLAGPTLAASPQERARYRELAANDYFLTTVWRIRADKDTGVIITSLLDDIIEECTGTYVNLVRDAKDERGKENAQIQAYQPVAQALSIGTSIYGVPGPILKRIPDQVKKYVAYQSAVESEKAKLSAGYAAPSGTAKATAA